MNSLPHGGAAKPDTNTFGAGIQAMHAASAVVAPPPAFNDDLEGIEEFRVQQFIARAGTEAAQAHLEEVSRQVEAEGHGVLLMDRAGSHVAEDLKALDNPTIILLPSRSPELNPVENIWQFLHRN